MPFVSIWTRLGIYGIIIGAIVLGALRLHEDGYNSGVADTQIKIDQANAKVIAAEAKAQAISDATAGTQNGAIDASIAQIQNSVQKILSVQSAAAKAKPLPADCIFDQDRIDETNKALLR